MDNPQLAQVVDQVLLAAPFEAAGALGAAKFPTSTPIEGTLAREGLAAAKARGRAPDGAGDR